MTNGRGNAAIFNSELLAIDTSLGAHASRVN